MNINQTRFGRDSRWISPLIFAAIVLLIALSAAVAAQTSEAERFELAFSNPGEPSFLETHLMAGSIRISGYDGTVVHVEARVAEDSMETEGRDDDDPRRRGLQRIRRRSSGLSIEERNNRMALHSRSNAAIALTIRVPRRTSLELRVTNGGEIAVDGVTGDIEVNNLNGPVSVTGVSGSVVAHALNRDITVQLDAVAPDTPMSFSSMNGAIDVTFPPDTRATLKLENEMGEIYTDFDIDFQDSGPEVTEDRRARGGAIRMENVLVGTINGGGPEFTFRNFNGDIYIRKRE